MNRQFNSFAGAVRAALLLGLFQYANLSAAAAPLEPMLGTWKGTSICTKIPGSEACKDEIVVYEFSRSAKKPDALTLKADKIVNGEQVTMFVFDMDYSPAKQRWEYEFNTRVRGLWTFSASGKDLTGTLYLLPDNIVARNAKARKVD